MVLANYYSFGRVIFCIEEKRTFSNGIYIQKGLGLDVTSKYQHLK